MTAPTTHGTTPDRTIPRALAALALIAALALAAPAAAADLPRLGPAPRVFPSASPMVDSESHASTGVPGYRGLSERDFDDYEFAVLCAVLAGVNAVLGVVFTAYSLEQDDPMWAGSAGLAFSLGGTFGAMGTVAGIKVETVRDRSHLRLRVSQQGSRAELGFSPAGFSMRF